jgi:hypothetical protein
MNDKELFVISGVVMRKLPTQWSEKNGKKFSRTVFIVKPYDGGKDLFVTKFGQFDTNLITKDIRVSCTKFNDTSYTVQGDIEVVEDAKTPAPAVQAPALTGEAITPEAPTAKRGRPKKTDVVAQSTPEPRSTLVEASVDAPSNNVLDIVALNITDAQTLITKLNLQNVSLLDLADMVGRTRVALRIEAGKDSRMASFRK